MNDNNSNGNESDGIECPRPHCDKVLDTKQGIKIHHSTVHGGPAYPNPVRCDNCGKVDHKNPNEVQDTNFCDDGCLKEYQSQKFNVVCANCGKPDEVSPSVYERNDNHYCNVDCRDEHYEKVRGGENSARWTDRIEVNCTWCDGSLKRLESHIADSGRVFCSDKECYPNWVSDHISGENHYNWKEENADPHSYGGMWRTQRVKAIDRDGHQCMFCGMGEEDHLDWCGKGLEVHHLIPYNDFDDPYEANKLDNLKTLCKSCHAQYELHTNERIVS